MVDELVVEGFMMDLVILVIVRLWFMGKKFLMLLRREVILDERVLVGMLVFLSLLVRWVEIVEKWLKRFEELDC